MGIASLIISIIGLVISCFGAIFALFAWRYSYKQYCINKIKKDKFTKESGFSKFQKDILEVLNQEPNIENPFSLSTDGQLRENDIKYCLFNMLQNIKDSQK